MYELDFGKPINEDNFELLPVIDLRKGRIDRSYDSQKPSGEELDRMAIREFKIGGAMIHGALSLTEQEGRIEFTPSGISLINPKRVTEFRQYLRGLLKIGNSDLLIREIQEMDPRYMMTVDLLAKMSIPHYKIATQGKELVFLSSGVGSQIGYDLLVGQEAEYRFRDATGWMK